ncbi:MAG TPA: hypothetical protein VFC50_02725 [Candidatus Dormibacteraeota bacterium]|nr:hypothetical protein [Candidatus Dormibacteraeota bacterium]
MRNPGAVLERPVQDPIAHLDFEPGQINLPDPLAGLDFEPDLAGLDTAPEQQSLAEEERCLTEVDNLNRYRRRDGSHAGWVLDDVFKNLIPFVKEGGMPNAVHKVEHPYRETERRDETGRRVKAYMWLGKTAIEHAESGYVFHKRQAALDRVGVEVDEARDTEANLRPGMTKIFISPRMSRSDASYEDAKAEHLGDDDALRISRAVTDEQGNIQKRAMESLLVRDIPLKAWVAMLEDPNNIFGKAISIDDPNSALSVMKVHRELEVPDDLLPEGVVSLVEAVIPYIDDDLLLGSVERQLERFHEDQNDMQDKAANIAGRWLDFEIALADSLEAGVAKPGISSFINSMQDKWNDKDLAVILNHQLPGAEYKMTRKLAVIVEQAKQKMLLVKASVVTGNKRIIDQMDNGVAEQVYRDEMAVQSAYGSGSPEVVLHLEAQQDRRIAGQNIRGVGGGCAGDNDTKFNSDGIQINAIGSSIVESLSDLEKRVGKISRARCKVETCPTRPNEVKVGGCGVCLGRCQELFDRGKDPTKMGTVTKATGKNTVKATVNFVTPPVESKNISIKTGERPTITANNTQNTPPRNTGKPR